MSMRERIYTGARNGRHDTTFVWALWRCRACGRSAALEDLLHQERVAAPNHGTGLWCPVCQSDEEIGHPEPLVIRTQAGAVYPKSPDGHAWGYGGSGPSQLALDILWDYMGEEPPAATFQAFKRKFIEPHQGERLLITGEDIDLFLAARSYERTNPGVAP